MNQGSITDETPSSEPVTASVWGQWRWKWLAGILLVGGIAEAAVWWGASPNRTYQVFFSMPVLSATLLACVLWWLLGGGLERIRLLRRLGVFVLAAAGFFGCLRFEGFEGDMFPRYRFRWTPSAKQRLTEFLSQTEPTKSETLPAPEAVLVAGASDWPEFRGVRRDGILASPLKFDWSVAPKELWRHPIGAGWSSFAVVDRFAFTQEQRDEKECVVAYDFVSGQQLWVQTTDTKFDEAMGGIGPRATPTFSNGRLYALGANGHLHCLDPMNGKVIWQRQILEDAKAQNINWAMSASPLIVEGKVIVAPGGAGGRSVIAYDAASGDEVWASGNDRASYAAPIRTTLRGQDQILVFDGVGLAGYALPDGKSLWKFGWTNQPQVNAVEPVVIDDTSLLIAGGYDLGGARLRISQKGDQWSVEPEWKTRRFHLKFNAPVVKDGFAYGLDEGILECIALADGQMKWKKGRYGYGQLLLVDEMLVIQSEQGDIAIVRASPERYEEIARIPALSSKTWNHPVVCRDLLLVRNAEEAACFRLPVIETPTSSSGDE